MNSPRTVVTGIVLVGGMSRRFGSNKALFPINGKPMARVVIDMMRVAGIADIYAVGDSPETAEYMGLSHIADSYPGEGPLGALISAMEVISTKFVCVLPCDVPRIHSSRIVQLTDQLVNSDEIDVAVLATSREHWLCSSWRISTCLPVLAKSFGDGERAIHEATSSLQIRRVKVGEGEMANINTLSEARKFKYMLSEEAGD